MPRRAFASCTRFWVKKGVQLDLVQRRGDGRRQRQPVKVIGVEDADPDGPHRPFGLQPLSARQDFAVASNWRGTGQCSR